MDFAESLEADLALPCPGGCGKSSFFCDCPRLTNEEFKSKVDAILRAKCGDDDLSTTGKPQNPSRTTN